MFHSKRNFLAWTVVCILLVATVVLAGRTGVRLGFVGGGGSSIYESKSNVIDSGGGRAGTARFESKASTGQVAIGNASSTVYQGKAGFLVSEMTVSCLKLGDINNDDACNSTDALIIVSNDIELPIPQECLDKINAGCGDVNADQLTNSTDALILVSFDIGLEVPFPVCEPLTPSPRGAIVSAVGAKGAAPPPPPTPANAGIIAKAAPSDVEVASGEQIVVPVNIDLANSTERLGSFTANLDWDPEVLLYMGYSGGTTEGFTNPIVNTSDVSIGRLVFSHANPEGGTGSVNVLNVTFDTIGPEGSSSSFDLTFSALSAAHTFIDLLPSFKGAVPQAKETVTITRPLPTTFALEQNFPNPFNPYTTIAYALPGGDRRQETGVRTTLLHVSLKIYNMLGQEVRTLVDEVKEPGYYSVTWDGRNESGLMSTSGVYFYRLAVDELILSRKMLLLK